MCASYELLPDDLLPVEGLLVAYLLGGKETAPLMLIR